MIGEISLARADPDSVRCRSSEVLTAAAFNGVPSLKRTPRRILIVIVFLSPERLGSAAASCGTIWSLAFRSYSFSHMCKKTMRPTKVRASVGSSASGSSARPIVSVPPAFDSAATEPPAPVASKPVATSASTARAVRDLRVRILFMSPPPDADASPSPSHALKRRDFTMCIHLTTDWIQCWYPLFRGRRPVVSCLLRTPGGDRTRGWALLRTARRRRRRRDGAAPRACGAATASGTHTPSRLARSSRSAPPA